MDGKLSMGRWSAAATLFAGAQALGIACSHERDLDAIHAMLKADAGAGGHGVPTTGGTSATGGVSSTGGAPPVNGTPVVQPWSGAMPLPPGTPVLTVATGDFTHYDQHDRELLPTPITVEGQPFVLGQRFPFGSGDGSMPGSAGYYGPIRSSVARGGLLRSFFWLRCGLADPSIGQCQSEVVFEKGLPPYTNGGLEFPMRVTENWTLLTQVFTPLDSYAIGSAQLTFRLGYPNQVLELGAIGLEDYGTSLTLRKLEALDQGPFVEFMTADSFVSYGTAVQSRLTGMEYPFGAALNFTTFGQTFKTPEDSGLQARTNAPVHAHALMLVTFWARCVQSADPSGVCRTSLVFEEGNSPYINAGLQTTAISVRPVWQQYFFPFHAASSYSPEEVKLGLRLGYPDQTIEFGPISLRAYDAGFTMADMPVSSLE